MALLTCPECGRQVSDKSEMCLTCGCPIEDIKSKEQEFKQEMSKKKRKRIATIGCAMAGVIIIVFIGSYLLLKPDTRGYYDGLKWTTTFEDVRKRVGDLSSIDEEDEMITEIVENYNSIEGVTSITSYYFDEEKLYKVSLEFLNDEEKSGMTNIELKQKLEDDLTKLYGDGKKIDSSEKIWITKYSKIDIWSYRSLLSLTYTDINYEDD